MTSALFKRRKLIVVVMAIAIASAVRLATSQSELTSPSTISLALGFAVPIALAGLAGIWSERSGVVNIGLEGMMILGSFAAGWAGWQHGAWASLVAGAFLGALGGLLLALITVTWNVDHIVAGTAVNLLALGLTKFLATAIFANEPGGGQSQSPPITSELPTVTWSAASDWLTSVHSHGWFVFSDVAGIAGGLINHLQVLVLITTAAFLFSTWVLWRTAFGLRVRGCGENPRAAHSLGIGVARTRYAAVTISGALAGLGGAYLAIATTMYRNGMTGGRGYIGLATTIFGNWRPGGTALGSLMFGYIDTIRLIDTSNRDVRALMILAAIALVTVGVMGLRRGRIAIVMLAVGIAAGALAMRAESLPPEVAQAAPYVTTLVVLAVASQRLRPPQSAGQPYSADEL